MTRRRSKRELENAVSNLEGRPDDADWVIVIGGPVGGCMTVEEYEEIYGEPVEEGVTIVQEEADR